MNIGAGKYDCWAAGSTLRIVDVKGERKAVVAIVADAGEPTPGEWWTTLDPKATTQAGKKRISFTIDGLKALGAVDPMRDIGMALKADPSAAEIEIEGLGKGIALLVAKESGSFVNLDVYPKREPVPASFADDILDLSDAGKKGAKAKAPTNLFPARPDRGAPIAPPVPAVRPAAAPVIDDTPF